MVDDEAIPWSGEGLIIKHKNSPRPHFLSSFNGAAEREKDPRTGDGTGDHEPRIPETSSKSHGKEDSPFPDLGS